MNMLASVFAAFFCLASPEGVKDPESLLKSHPMDLPEEWYLDFTKTGDRQRHGKPYGQRTAKLEELVWAEQNDGCKGRFVGKIAEFLRAFNAMKSWNIPAHDASLESWNGTPHIDLGSSRIALAFAQALVVCGDKLPADLVKECRENVERRQFKPYFRTLAGEKIKDHWWFHTGNNWNAVCNGNVVMSALLFYPYGSEERAKIVDAAVKAFPYFLAGFADDGYCTEGAGYWSYGFGHYLLAGLALRDAPEKIDLFHQDPKVKLIARYGYEYKLDAGLSPRFADGAGTPAKCYLDIVTKIWPDLRLDLGLRTEFPAAQVWICRDKNFAVGFKGGHNDEFHNHNDLGSYDVLVNGRIVSGDVGGEVYTRRTFSKDRYVSKVLNSYAHPVPRFGGVLQGTGAKYRAKVVKTAFADDKDVVVLDLTAAYPKEANLASFIRTFTFTRGAEAAFEIKDEIRLSEPTVVEDPFVWTGENPLYPRMVCDCKESEAFEEKVENPGKSEVRIAGLRTTKPVSDVTFRFVFRSAGAEDVSFSKAGDFERPANPDGLSAISHLDGDRYWVVDDEGGRLLQARIPLDPATGAPMGWEVVSSFTVPGASDLEGVAADPLASAVVWVADEKNACVSGYDTTSDRVVAKVSLPELAAAKNRGVESLAVSPDGLTLWTCLESPIDDDGPFVRLFRYVRGGVSDQWRLSGSWAVPFEAKEQKIKKVSFRTSVSDLAVLSDGRLVMMELAKMKIRKVRTGKIVLSAIDISEATDITAVASLAGKDFKPAAKQRIYDLDTGLALYEGLCEGPRLANGDRTMLLVSDAEKGGEHKVLSLRLGSCSSDPSHPKGDR